MQGHGIGQLLRAARTLQGVVDGIELTAQFGHFLAEFHELRPAVGLIGLAAAHLAVHLIDLSLQSVVLTGGHAGSKHEGQRQKGKVAAPSHKIHNLFS